MVTTNFNPGVPAGDHLFATIELECVSCGDTSDIEFTMVRPDGTYVHNGTVTCVAGEQPPCLGTCYNNSECNDPFAENVSCKDCIGGTAPLGSTYLDPEYWWHPNKDTACFGDATPSDLYIDWCPECCDGVDNDDGDADTDYPADKECPCGLAMSEDTGGPILPELPTLALASIGILGAILLARKRE